MDAIAGAQLPMPHAVNAAGDAAGPASARPTVPSKDRKAAARRRQGVPEDFIVPSVFWVRDANLGLWLEYKFGVNQLVAEWRDISKMVATGKKLSDDEMCDGKMYSVPNLFGTGAAASLQNLDERATDKQLTRPSILDASVANHASSAAAANHLLFTERMLMVRICRQKLNYCVGGSIEEPTVEILAAINSAIQTFFGPSHTTTAKSLTAEEVKVWAYHEVPLTDATLGFYTPQLAAYQTATNNILDMLNTSSTRFSQANLGNEAFAQISALRYVVLGGVGPITTGTRDGANTFTPDAAGGEKGSTWGEDSTALDVLYGMKIDCLQPLDPYPPSSLITLRAPDGTNVNLSARGARFATITITDFKKLFAYFNQIVTSRDSNQIRKRKASGDGPSSGPSLPAAIKASDVGKTISVSDGKLYIGGLERQVDWGDIPHDDFAETTITNAAGSHKGGIVCGNGTVLLNPARIQAEGEARLAGRRRAFKQEHASLERTIDSCKEMLVNALKDHNDLPSHEVLTTKTLKELTELAVGLLAADSPENTFINNVFERLGLKEELSFATALAKLDKLKAPPLHEGKEKEKLQAALGKLFSSASAAKSAAETVTGSAGKTKAAAIKAMVAHVFGSEA